MTLRKQLKKPKKPDVTVFLVDIGVYHVTFTADIKIAYHFGHIPILACRFVLDNVCSLKGEEGFWDEDITNLIGDFLHYHHKRCSTNGTCTVIQTRHADNFPIPIELKFQSPDRPEEWLDLSEKLVNHWKKALWLPEGRILNINAAKYLEEADEIEAVAAKNDGSSTLHENRDSCPGKFDEEAEQVSPCSNTSELVDDMSLNPWNLPTRHFYIGQVLKVEVITCFSWKPYMTVYLKESTEIVSHVAKILSKHSPKCIPVNPYPGLPVTCCLNKKWQRGFIMKVKNPCTMVNAITKLAVYFVDSNESKWIKNTKKIRCMSTKLQELPMYSFQIFYNDTSRLGDKTLLVKKIQQACKNRENIYIEVTNGGLSTNKVHGKVLIGKNLIPVMDYDENDNLRSLELK